MTEEAQTQAAPTEPQQECQIDPKEEAAGLQKLLSQGMPTDTEMRQAGPRVVSRHIRWERDNARHIARYTELRRADPSLPSIESLRLP